MTILEDVLREEYERSARIIEVIEREMERLTPGSERYLELEGDLRDRHSDRRMIERAMGDRL